ncbi:MAG: DUF6930 domain-containing protein [Oscillospiraceae bacterium]
MNKKQLAKWKEIYSNMMKITEYAPWEFISENTPLFYRPAGGSDDIVFTIWGYNSDACGVACYFSTLDYAMARMRLKSKNTKNEPVFIMQNMILGLWGDREEVGKENKELIKELGLKFRGKGGWLFFEKIIERREPMFPDYDDAVVLADALGNLYMMLKAVCEKGLKADFEHGQTIRRFLGEDGTWYNKAIYPDFSELSLEAEMQYSPALKRLRDMPSGELSIELDERCIPMPVEAEDKTIYMPLIITAVNSKTGQPLSMKNVAYNESREEVLFDLITDLSESFGKIRQIKINSEFLKITIADFCKKTGIKLNYQQKPLKYIDRMYEKLFSADPEELSKLLAGEDDSDADIEQQRFDDEPSDEPDRSRLISVGRNDPQTFVISVSLGKGCYRHIRISGDETLEGLHSVILNTFGFEDDHLHAFFLDNKAWSRSSCYFSQYCEGESKASCDYTLSQLLEEGQKFLYLFDFGDEWRFSCRVLHIYAEPCKMTRIIRSVGEPPEQYPDY